MALIVFLRGVNVGGHKTFQPAALARKLSHLGAVNVGAAGTFVIRGHCSQAALREEFAGKLKFPAELLLCSSRELIELVGREPFGVQPAAGDVRRFVSVLKSKPRVRPPLPLDLPPNEQWQVRFIEISDRFALGWWRLVGKRFTDPNAVAERILGVTATTRNWNTIVKLAAVMARSQTAS